MDSLTQLALGAACGEAVAGKKIGNKALFWGGIGGTLPDLDVLANGFLDEVSATAFHRGLTHSAVFAVLMPFLLAALCMKIYRKNPKLNYQTWYGLFFLSIFTHPILDNFTSWGTQFLYPFSDLRIQWNTISVVDPVATIPFIIALVLVARRAAGTAWRTRWLWLGLVWFCGYILLYTGYHKWRVQQIFEASLRAKNISYHRLMTGPTIFNNLLWLGIAEGDTAYYHGLYSFNDPTAAVLRFNVLPKNHEKLASARLNERSEYFIKWFSNGYFNIIENEDNQLRINDLRFGLLGDSVLNSKSYVFPFAVVPDPLGGNTLTQKRDVSQAKTAFKGLWRRIWSMD